MLIEIVNVGQVQKDAKYFFFMLDYKNEGKQDKPKKIVSFSPAYNVLKSANQGEFYEVQLVKKDGFWSWEDVKKAQAPTATTASTGSVGVSTGRGGNWETAEERAFRQILIVRQSCLAQAREFIQGLPGSSPQNIEDLAEQWEKWVFRTAKVEEFKDDIPY